MLLSRRALLATGLAAATLPAPAFAGPRAELIDGPWQRFGSVTGVDDTEWRALLAQHWVMGSDGVALLDWGAIDRAALKPYLDRLAATDPTTLTRDAAFAFWVNVYNAVTVDVVASEYPVTSIKQVRGGLFNTGPWGDKLITVAGRDLTLDEVEHGILRPVFDDPRIHYAVNCASIGCPDLKPTPWTAETLETDLNAAATNFIAHPRAVNVQSNGLRLSKIFDWFIEDFGDSEPGILNHIRQYASPELATTLETNTRIRGYDYDWSLNDV
ncbi:MAG: DUF547 domain-containing protein [Pseudomonadota bacterium]